MHFSLPCWRRPFSECLHIFLIILRHYTLVFSSPGSINGYIITPFNVKVISYIEITLVAIWATFFTSSQRLISKCLALFRRILINSHIVNLSWFNWDFFVSRSTVPSTTTHLIRIYVHPVIFAFATYRAIPLSFKKRALATYTYSHTLFNEWDKTTSSFLVILLLSRTFPSWFLFKWKLPIQPSTSLICITNLDCSLSKWSLLKSSLARHHISAIYRDNRNISSPINYVINFNRRPNLTVESNQISRIEAPT